MLASFDDLFSGTRPSFKIPPRRSSYFSVNSRKSMFAWGKSKRFGMRVFRGGALKERGTGSRVTPNSYQLAEPRKLGVVSLASTASSGWSSEVFDGVPVLFEQCCHVHRDSTGIGKLSSCSSTRNSATGSGTGSLAGLYNMSTSATHTQKHGSSSATLLRVRYSRPVSIGSWPVTTRSADCQCQCLAVMLESRVALTSKIIGIRVSPRITQHTVAQEVRRRSHWSQGVCRRRLVTPGFYSRSTGLNLNTQAAVKSSPSTDRQTHIITRSRRTARRRASAPRSSAPSPSVRRHRHVRRRPRSPPGRQASPLAAP